MDIFLRKRYRFTALIEMPVKSSARDIAEFKHSLQHNLIS